MVCVKRHYYTESASRSITVTLKDLCLGFMPLIWCNGGMYGIICKEKVENMIETLQDDEHSPILNSNKLKGAFYWDEVIELDQKIGRLLTR